MNWLTNVHSSGLRDNIGYPTRLVHHIYQTGLALDNKRQAFCVNKEL